MDSGLIYYSISAVKFAYCAVLYYTVSHNAMCLIQPLIIWHEMPQFLTPFTPKDIFNTKLHLKKNWLFKKKKIINGYSCWIKHDQDVYKCSKVIWQHMMSSISRTIFVHIVGIYIQYIAQYSECSMLVFRPNITYAALQNWAFLNDFECCLNYMSVSDITRALDDGRSQVGIMGRKLRNKRHTFIIDSVRLQYTLLHTHVTSLLECSVYFTLPETDDCHKIRYSNDTLLATLSLFI